MISYHLTRVSANRKTGPIPVSTTSRQSCPPSCPLFNNGCYAEVGPLAWHWAKIGQAGRGVDLDQFAREIRALPGRTLWRHNQAGDLPGNGESINGAQLNRLVRANKGKRGFTYTHKPLTPSNLAKIRAANSDGFTINLSANNGTHADILAGTGLPVVVIIPTDAPKVSRTPAGRKIVQCPAENSDRITCANCGLCQLGDRPYLIGFKPKGCKSAAANSLSKETTL
jgi:hypothetical protein